ncbi:hypothetical protein TNIN_160301 [Trichonephila inaurata madagascariensis]|uniref:Uncharacterized protein n=1 Tax=Trichonephila inaurata madagascariensis TaxID=2747483 RepID=A0A8X6Y825_9ARAC|nr:hypothetical protein TNIN_160301 [Trichonephila inaurata madagascariensis]
MALPNVSGARAFSTQVNSAHAPPGVLSVRVTTLQKIVSSLLTRNPSAVFAKVNILPASWAARKTPETRLKKKTTPKTATKPTQVKNKTPAPPKVNFWGQRAKNAAERQQPNPSTSKKSYQATPSQLPTSPPNLP